MSDRVPPVAVAKAQGGKEYVYEDPFHALFGDITHTNWISYKLKNQENLVSDDQNQLKTFFQLIWNQL